MLCKKLCINIAVIGDSLYVTAGKMYSTSDRLYSATECRFHYDLDTFLGQDGALIFYKDPNNASRRICIGIHTTEGSPLNSGVRFFRTLYNWIKSTEQSFS